MVRLGGLRAGLGGVCRLEVLEQTRNLRQVLQLEWVIVSGKRDVYIFEACFGGIRLWALFEVLWCTFPRKLP